MLSWVAEGRENQEKTVITQLYQIVPQSQDLRNPLKTNIREEGFEPPTN